MNFPMPFQLIQSQKPFPTPLNLTNKIPLPQMYFLMFPQITAFPKPFPTNFTLQRFFSRMYPRMHQQRRRCGKRFKTQGTRVGARIGV